MKELAELTETREWMGKILTRKSRETETQFQKRCLKESVSLLMRRAAWEAKMERFAALKKLFAVCRPHSDLLEFVPESIALEAVRLDLCSDIFWEDGELYLCCECSAVEARYVNVLARIVTVLGDPVPD